ncbi:MAG TPA: P-loop NTPase [Gemmatimonadota bacterium]|nr:P-loop NTPase [Gemmatimonadota bacterium]
MTAGTSPRAGGGHSIRTYHEVADPGAEGVVAQIRDQARRLSDRLSRIGAVAAVASGKGGVGKSSVTANLAAVLASRGRAVGAADLDLHGPTLARMLGAPRAPLSVGEDGVRPAQGTLGVRLMSMDLLLASADATVRWKGPEEGAFAWQGTLEAGTAREFLADTAWGDLDLLLLDLPPGTDRLARILEILPGLDALLLVTTPSEAARAGVARSARLAREAGIRVTGLVANMTAWRCPECGRETRLFEADGAGRLAADTGLARWAEIPFDPRLAVATDDGRPFAIVEPDAPASRALRALADRLEAEIGGRA